VKPTNPPATFEELQERMEALDELANMTEQESSYTLCTCSMHAHTLCVFTPIDLDWKPARELEVPPQLKSASLTLEQFCDRLKTVLFFRSYA